ncbi:MAG: 50S ribosomal protein L1 [Candidatus Woykebacteria bacterium]
MGRPRIKTIETALEPEKVDTLEKERFEASQEVEEKVKEEVKAKRQVKKSKHSKQKTRSVRYKSLADQVDKTKDYTLTVGFDILKKAATTKFDESLEAHINLNIDPTKSEQLIRKSINLPHFSGKKLKVLVFGLGSKEAKITGVEIGTEATLDKIAGGKVEVDKIIATPEWMPKLAKVAKILGPKGLMPNPKSNTVTSDPEKIIKDLQNGMVEVKTEKSPIIHSVLGKLSLPNDKLEQNVKVLIGEIQKSKPETLKKPLIKSVYLSSTMGPSIRVDLSSL